MVPTGDGRFIAWEKAGRAWMGPDGQASIEPMLDIRDEVGNSATTGCSASPPTPTSTNGRIYALYVVDRHHLLFEDTPTYDPDVNDYFSATIGRITRYTATSESGLAVVDPESRTVLLGTSMSDGLPILHQSHAVGSLAFGQDGTLLASMGDSASYGTVDLGGPVDGGSVEQASTTASSPPARTSAMSGPNLIDTLAGKILRIDPETGNGVPSNPYFTKSLPRLARSRVWTLGLRNAFRITVAPARARPIQRRVIPHDRLRRRRLVDQGGRRARPRASRKSRLAAVRGPRPDRRLLGNERPELPRAEPARLRHLRGPLHVPGPAGGGGSNAVEPLRSRHG